VSAVLWIHIYIPNNIKSMGMRKLWAGGGGQFSAPPPAYYIILLQHISTGNVFLHIGGYVPRLTLRLHFPWPSFLRDSITRVFIRFLRGQHHRILLFHLGGGLVGGTHPFFTRRESHEITSISKLIVHSP